MICLNECTDIEGTLGEENVIEAKIVKDGPLLHMVTTGYGTERDNLDEPDALDVARSEADREIARRLSEGETYRSISKDMGVSTNAICRVSKSLKSSDAA